MFTRRARQSLRSCRLRIHPPNRFYYSSKSLPSGDSDSIGIETFFPRSSRAQFSVGRRQILPSAQTRFDSGRQPVRRGPSPCFHCDLVSVSAARSPRLLQRLTATTVRTLTLLAINNNSNKEAAEAFPRPSPAQSYPQRVHSCRFFCSNNRIIRVTDDMPLRPDGLGFILCYWGRRACPGSTAA